MDPAFATSIEFDSAAMWSVESYDAYLKAYADPYYVNVIEPDEHNFVDKGQLDGQGAGTGKKTVVRAVSTLGVCRSMIKDGKAAVAVEDGIWHTFKQYKAKEAASKGE
jgi:hypothetical protein